METEISDFLPFLVFEILLLGISFYNKNIALFVFLETYMKENMRWR